MNVNRQVVISGFVIIGTGIIRAAQGKTDYTTVLVGGYVFLLVMSILDLFGGNLSRLASILALLAALYVVIDKFPWDIVINLIQGKK
jgi:hypothetical protein